MDVIQNQLFFILGISAQFGIIYFLNISHNIRGMGRRVWYIFIITDRRLHKDIKFRFTDNALSAIKEVLRQETIQ